MAQQEVEKERPVLLGVVRLLLLMRRALRFDLTAAAEALDAMVPTRA